MRWLETGAVMTVAWCALVPTEVLGDMRARAVLSSPARATMGAAYAGPQARPRVSCSAGSAGKRGVRWNGGAARLGGGVAAAGAEAKATTQAAGYACPRPATRARRVVAAAGAAGGVQPGEGDPESCGSSRS